MCQRLHDAITLHEKLFFDVPGGCGIDTSLGESNCMDRAGLWFKFCPFCGCRIIAEFKPDSHWEWHFE